jgi:hypothetical protein
LTSLTGSTCTYASITPTNFNVCSNNAQFGGIKYAADYSTYFTPRSLVDKAYVTGLTTTSGVQTANNGLTKVGTNVVLGGALTGNTTLNVSANTLTISTKGGLLNVGNNITGNYLGIDERGVEIHPEETVSRTIYVATGGSDSSGDGSVGNPYLTLLKAVQTIKTVINSGVTITIQIQPGTYNLTWKPIEKEFSRFIVMNAASGIKSISIVGGMTQLTSGFVLTPGSPDAYNYTSTATWTTNQYQDKFLLVGANYFPILQTVRTH